MGNRLYVGNLPFSVQPEALRQAFSASGEVTDVHIVSDRETGQSRGFGFVTMGNAAEAQAAIQAMNGTMLEGRALRVNEAEDRPARGGGGGGFGGGGRGGGGGGGYGGGGGRGGGGGYGGGGGRGNKW
jgi:RNA recognition motif-containing protein